jgi:Protein of unknown function (DUF3048) N-terminal domain/Protein of unknown function (DUF3048) C-terminal domain
MRDWWAGVASALRRHPRAFAAGGGGLLAVAAGAVAALLLLTSSPAAPPRPAAEPTRAVATTRPKPVRLVSPFTGEPVARLGPVIAVKIDNIVNARPQTGLQDADIVYALPVEGGLSRFLAVFSSHLPPVIGPVRSAREDDLELLQQFGRPGFAYSGAAPHLLPFVERAPIVDLYAGLPAIAPAYYRYAGRVAPYNLYVSSHALLAEAKAASDARDIGFRFGPLPASAAGTAVAAAGYSAGYSASSFTFRWSARDGRWLVWMDGSAAMATSVGPSAAESQLGAATIIIQRTVIRTSRFLEYGKPPPYAQTTGSGTAVVLRGGKAYTVHWSRPSARGGTIYTLPSGARMTFAPGQVWVVLVS